MAWLIISILAFGMLVDNVLGESQYITIPSSLDQQITEHVSFDRTVIFAYSFNTTAGGIPDAIKLSISCKKVRPDFPLLITIKQRQDVSVMTCPLGSNHTVIKPGETVPACVNRTLEVHKDDASGKKKLSVVNMLIEVSTANPMTTRFDILTIKDTSFFLPEKTKTKVLLDQSSPAIFKVSPPDNGAEVSYYNVRLSSRQHKCMKFFVTMGFPTFDLFGNMTLGSDKAISATADLSAGFPVQINDYPNGFYLTLTALPTDITCKSSVVNGSELMQIKEKEVEIFLESISFDARFAGAVGGYLALLCLVTLFSTATLWKSKSRATLNYQTVSEYEDSEDPENIEPRVEEPSDEDNEKLSVDNDDIPEPTAPIGDDLAPSASSQQSGPGYANVKEMKKEMLQSFQDQMLNPNEQTPGFNNPPITVTENHPVVAYVPQNNQDIEANEVLNDDDPVDNTNDITSTTFPTNRSQETLQPTQNFRNQFLSIGIFFSIPMLQSTMFKETMIGTIGDQDVCFQNYLCSIPVLGIDGFNHMVSNSGYLILGLVFFALNYRSNVMDQSRGLPDQSHLYQMLGLCLTIEGIMSASYHVCPSKENLQFDVLFINICIVIITLKNYDLTQEGSNAKIFNFAMISTLTLTFSGLFMDDKAGSIVTLILGSLGCIIFNGMMFYKGETRLVWGNDAIKIYRPTTFKAPMVWGVSAINVSTMILGTVLNWKDVLDLQSTFVLLLLEIMLASSIWTYKRLWRGRSVDPRERSSALTYYIIATAAILWLGSLAFYFNKTYDVNSKPAESRRFNSECLLLSFYDSHDVWHILSALAAFMTLLGLKKMDETFLEIPRIELKARLQ